MEYFRNAQKVRLQTPKWKFLIAKDDETVALGEDGSSTSAWWSVEIVPDSDSVVRLKSCYCRYLAASDQPSLISGRFSVTGTNDLSKPSYKVLQSLPGPLDSSLEWEPMTDTNHVKLRTYRGSFLNGNRDPVTHDFFNSTVTPDWVFWDVVKSEEEGSAAKSPCETGKGSSVTESILGDSDLTQGDDQLGLHGHKEQLIKLLLKDNSGTTDVLVRGRSGITALVRKVCEDDRTKEHFHTIKWISVPQKYDSELICEEILLQLLFENAPFQNDVDACGVEIEDKGVCLIVVDNLVDQRTQDALKKVSVSKETFRVIFIARHQTDLPYRLSGRQLETYELKEDLSEEEPWAHFREMSPERPSPLEQVCQLIVRKFESMSEAIVLHLRDRKDVGTERKSIIFPSFERNDEWAPVNLPSPDFPSFNLIRQVWEILYTHNHRLCLWYLSIFPANSLISCKKVSRLWAAEGCLPDLGEAQRFFQDLLDRKCINRAEERSDGELSTFRLDNLVREIIVSLFNHRNLVFDHGKLITLTSQGSTNWPERVRYLSVRGTIEDLKGKDLVQLSSIFTHDLSSSENKTTTFEGSPSEIYETSSFPLKLLHSKVLDLEGAPFQIAPDALFELTEVRYLSLKKTSIKVIPSSIKKLMHLEFLDVKHSLVTELPREVERLEKIRHILIYHHEKDPLMESYNLIGFKASCSVGRFKCLEELCFVESDNSLMKDLENLTKLRRLGITKLRAEHCKSLCSSLQKLKMLKSLNVHAYDEDEIIDLNDLSLSTFESLKHLYLHGRLEKLPNQMSSVLSLTRIILRWSRLGEGLLASLGILPNLVELELRRAYDGKQLEFKEGQYKKLKILLLDELAGLISMSLELGTLPCLEDLTISRCHWLERIPSGIEHLHKIRKLTFFDMSNEFYDKVRADHEKNGYEIFKLIKEVYLTRWRAGHWKGTDEVRCSHQVESIDEAQCSRQLESTDEAQCSRQLESTDGVCL